MNLAAPSMVGVHRRESFSAEIEHAGRVARFLAGTVAVFALTLAAGLTVLALAPQVVSDWEAVVVTSGSMAPAIEPGDIVVSRPAGHDPVPTGSIVVFADTSRAGALVTHRVTGVDENGALVTKGDANQSPDQTAVDPDLVVGVGRMVVPSVATPVLRLREGAWGGVLVYLAAITGCLYVARFGVLARYDPWAVT